MSDYQFAAFKLLILTVHWINPSNADCIFGESDDCSLPCRCLINSDGGCNKLTGECDTQACLQIDSTGSLIGHEWSGPKCQTGNVAYGKSAYIDDHSGLVSYKQLTDGIISLDGCLQELSPASGKLTVIIDLGTVHKLKSITLYLSDIGSHEVLVEVSMGSSRNITSYTPCGESIQSTSEKHFTLPCVAIGQTVRATFQNPNIAVCEVKIQGHVYKELDCTNCQGECHPNLFCESCQDGFQLPGCTKECQDGTYGSNCVNKCGKCLNSGPCHKVSGECDSGCERWYTRSHCNFYVAADVSSRILPPTLYIAYSSALTINIHRLRETSGYSMWNYVFRIEYALQGGEYHMTNDRVFEGHIEQSGYGITVRNLKPYTVYSMRAVVYRVWGDVEELAGISTPLVATTACFGPQVLELTTQQLSKNEMLLSWQNTSVNCEYITVAEIFSAEAKGNGTFALIKSISGEIHSVSIDVKIDTSYYFKVRLTNDGNYNAESPIILYDPEAISDKNPEETTEEQSYDEVYHYLYGLTCIVGVLFVAVVILSIVLCRKIASKKTDKDMNLNSMQNGGYQQNQFTQQVTQHHPYEEML